MAQIIQPYKVPVVFNDLTQAETLSDVLYALETLSGTIDDIFNRIEKRIQDERKRVDQINVRAATCKGKVEKVRGTTKATTVFSTSKFPAPKSLPAYPTLFSQLVETRSPYRDVDDEVQYVPAHPSNTTIGNRELATEVQDILLRLNNEGTDMERVEFLMEDHGLGPMPPTVPSVGSMLLFNTNVNPYEEYRALDNLVFTGREKVVDEDKQKVLAQAPQTMLDGASLPDIQGLDLTYKPEMGTMNSLALPENLPLDFIASGIAYQGLDLPSIAPSSHARANYNLPQITDGGASAAPAVTDGSGAGAGGPPPPPAAAGAPPPPPPPPAGAPPPPPPPPPAAAANPAAAAVGAPPPPPPPAAARPPPPPPAPPAAAQSQVVVEDVDDDDDDVGASAAPAGPRSGLMDAIKGMSVMKLRSKEESAMAAAKVQKKVDQNKPLSMHDALKERLGRRNAAISGKSDKEQKARDSVIVQQARANSSLSLPRASKPKSLTTVGFAGIDEGNEGNGSDDEFNYTTRTSLHKATVDSGSDSDDASDFTDDSPAQPSPPPPARSRPASSSLAPPAPPRPASTSPAPPPAPMERRGSGLMDTSNAHLSNMLSVAASKAGATEGSDDDDDWD